MCGKPLNSCPRSLSQFPFIFLILTTHFGRCIVTKSFILRLKCHFFRSVTRQKTSGKSSQKAYGVRPFLACRIIFMRALKVAVDLADYVCISDKSELITITLLKFILTPVMVIMSNLITHLTLTKWKHGMNPCRLRIRRVKPAIDF